MWIVCGAGLHLGEAGAGGEGVEASMATSEKEIPGSRAEQSSLSTRVQAAEETDWGHTRSGYETCLKPPPPTPENPSRFCILVPPTKKANKTLTGFSLLGPAEAAEGRDGALPHRLRSATAAARASSPCSHRPAPRAPAPRLPTDTPPPHTRPRPNSSASTAPGRPEAAAVPPEAAAARRGRCHIDSQWKGSSLQALLSLAVLTEGRSLGAGSPPNVSRAAAEDGSAVSGARCAERRPPQRLKSGVHACWGPGCFPPFRRGAFSRLIPAWRWFCTEPALSGANAGCPSAPSGRVARRVESGSGGVTRKTLRDILFS